MNQFSIALVSARAASNLDDDLAPLQVALTSVGINVHIVNWDDPAIDWSTFDLALLRSTWDYSMRLPEFLAWAKRVSALTTLLNPLPVIRWNTDKHCLSELAQLNVPTVQSHFIEPGENAAAGLDAFLKCHADAAEFVTKPAIGAGSRDAQRYARTERDSAIAHAQKLLDAQRSVLLQPYLDHVDEHGETALVFFAGKFSHAIRKGPLLRRGESPTRALFATEHITPRTPDADELRAAGQTLAAIPFTQPLLYARVDLIRDANGAPRVLELELTEPSLFFAHSPDSAEHFARAILERMTSGLRSTSSTPITRSLA